MWPPSWRGALRDTHHDILYRCGCRGCDRDPRAFLASGVDKSVSQILKFSVPFEVPSQALRQQLWRKLVPSKTPIEADVDYAYLAERFDFVGSSIHSAIFKVQYSMRAAWCDMVPASAWYRAVGSLVACEAACAQPAYARYGPVHDGVRLRSAVAVHAGRLRCSAA